MQEHEQANDEIDLIELIRHIWEGRKIILYTTVFFVLLGLLSTLTAREQYTAGAKMLPESGSSGGASSLMKQFGLFGGMGAGMVNEQQDAIRPDLYPDVLQSTPFYLELLELQVQTVDKEGQVIHSSLYEYLQSETLTPLSWIKRHTIGLPGIVLSWFQSAEKETNAAIANLGTSQLIHMSKEEHKAIKRLQGKISAEIKNQTGIISISVLFPSPQLAAQVAHFSLNYLSAYITSYRIEKAQKDLDFITRRWEEKKAQYEAAQLTLAQFRDANRNTRAATVLAEEQRLQQQYTLAFNIYNELYKQREQALIKVQEETPVIKVLEPVSVPVEKTKPKRGMVIVIFTLLGGFMGIGIVFGKLIWIELGHELAKKNSSS